MKKVIIIGAGPAGITAGYELMKQSNEYEVTILEETSYIGGISRTEVYNGHRMDIGGHRFFSKSQEVNDWWEQIMPLQGAPAYDDDKLNRDVPLSKGGPNPEKADRVMLNRSRISHIYYNRKFFEYPVKMNKDTIKNMGFGTTMQAGFSYLGSMIAKKPENSLENFYINQFGKKLYSMFFEGYTEKLWGRHPREIDPSWGAQRTKGLSITEIVKDATRKAFHKEVKDVNTSLISAFKYPKLGPGQLWECAAADFEAMGGSIHYNCRVIRINTNGNQVESVTCAVDGITIEEKADIVISSMPIKDLIIGMSNVPANVTEVARKLPYRDFVTVGLLVPKLRISNTTYMRTLGNVIPDTWIYVQDTGVKMGRIQIFNNWSPYLLENPEKTVWVGLEYFCNEGDRYWNMTDEEWIQFATKELVQMGILSESTKVLDSHKVAVKKAYPAYFDSYSRFDEVRTYLDGFENLYCVGRNGQHRYNNMDHSMITAFETVKNILSGEKDKSNIWNVNTEQEYHEEKTVQKEEKQAEVKEDKPVTTAAPVPPVKEEVKPAEAAAPVAPAPVKVAEPEKKEEEIQATVQAVPTPPVRRQLRRNPVPKTVVEEPVVESVAAVAATASTAAVVNEVVQEPVQAVSEVQNIVTESVPVEAEIHVSKSRSIWDDVAYAEATAEVKTAPIRFKTVEEAHAAVKGTTVEKVSVHKEDKKAEENKETPIAEEVKEAVAAEEKAEVAPVVESEVKEEKPKKTTRGRKKKAEPVTEASVEAVKEEVPAVEEVKAEEAPVAEESKADVTEVAPVAENEVKEEKKEEPKKPTRTRRKKVAEVKEETIPAVEETKVEETPVAEEKKADEMSVEDVKTEEIPGEEEVKTEESSVVKETKTDETVEEPKAETTEEEKVEPAKEKQEEPKKPTRTRRKKPTEVKEEVKAEPEPEEMVVVDVPVEESKAEVVVETVAEEPKAEIVVEAVAEESKAEVVEETVVEETKTEVAEEVIAEEPQEEEVKRPSRSTTGKTIAGRSSSRRVSDNRHGSSHRKVEDSKKPASNVGKEAVFGNMKGTVIKSNVIQKTPEETKKTTGSSRR